eukprot:COSAG01_NODE_62550_length_284_cov_0.578378_1_plen_24_part_10
MTQNDVAADWKSYPHHKPFPPPGA